jgi:hypothetical protein
MHRALFSELSSIFKGKRVVTFPTFFLFNNSIGVVPFPAIITSIKDVVLLSKHAKMIKYAVNLFQIS